MATSTAAHTLALEAAHAARLSPPATAALAYRLAHRAWPWAACPWLPRARARVRHELRRAGFTAGGAPHLPSIRAAAALWRAGLREEVGP